jgi:uncharacterized protein YlzI (FlbEa/FlbD family)
METFITLHDTDGNELFVNADNIAYIEKDPDGPSIIHFIASGSSDNREYVRESLAEIKRRLE